MAAKFEAQIESIEASGDHHESVLQLGTDITDDEAREFKEWETLPRSLRIVVTGKTGAGKSTLLNGFVGGKTRSFKEGDGLDAETLEVNQHTFKRHNVEVTVWDCPGLQDGTKNEEAYLKDLKKKTNGDIDVMLYCISMEDIRFDRQCHGVAMQYLTQVFGHRVWKHTVIVLTFANCVVNRLKHQVSSTLEEDFEDKVKQWKSKIQEMLLEINCTEKPSDVEKIQVVPAGFKKPALPGCKYWLSSLWIAIFTTLKTDEAKAAAIALNKHRFRRDPEQKYTAAFGKAERPPPVTDEEFKKEIEDQPIIITPDMEAYLHKVGAEIVAISSAGVVVGATIGGVVAGVASLGIGAPVGAGVGGIIGGGIGFIASTLFRVYKHRKAAGQVKSTSRVKPPAEDSSDSTSNQDEQLSVSEVENADNESLN